MQIKEITVTCACCGKQSAQKLITDCAALGYMDLDTRPPEERRSAIEHEVQECPECHYCSEDISAPLKGIAQGDVGSAAYLGILSDDGNDPIVKKFLLSGYLYQKAGDSRRAGLQLMRVAWHCDDLGDTSAANDAREVAISFLKEANDKEFNAATALIIADMYRRIGKFWDATTELNIASNQTSDPLLASITGYEKRLIVLHDTAAHNIGERPDAGK